MKLLAAFCWLYVGSPACAASSPELEDILSLKARAQEAAGEFGSSPERGDILSRPVPWFNYATYDDTLWGDLCLSAQIPCGLDLCIEPGLRDRTASRNWLEGEKFYRRKTGRRPPKGASEDEGLRWGGEVENFWRKYHEARFENIGDGSVRAAAEELARRNPRFAWRLDRGILMVEPVRKAGAKPGPSAALDKVIPEFSATDKNIDRVAKMLFELAGMRGEPSPFRGPSWQGLTLHMRNAAVREILNEAVRQHGGSMWTFDCTAKRDHLWMTTWK